MSNRVTPFVSGCFASPIRSWCESPLYVMATGYDIDIAPSGIVFQCSVYYSIDKCCSDKSA